MKRARNLRVMLMNLLERRVQTGLRKEGLESADRRGEHREVQGLVVLLRSKSSKRRRVAGS